MTHRTSLLGLAGAVVLAALVLLMPTLLGQYYLTLLTESLIYGIVALSLDLVWGYTGIPDLGHALWFGTGALAVGMMTTDLDPTGLVLGTKPGFWPHLAGVGIGVVVAGVAALLVALMSFSQREAEPFYIAIVTLALTVVAATLYGQTERWTGGENGLFGFLFSTQILIWVAVGGRGTILGPIVGAIGLSFVTSKLSSSFPTEWSLFIGILFVLVVVFVPDGVLPPAWRLVRARLLGRWRHRDHRRLVEVSRGRPALREAGKPVAVAEDVEFGYGSLRVLRGVDFEMAAGELLCIVGPNGAGKSTLLNVLTNGQLPMTGTITYHLESGELTRRGAPIHKLARAGIARKFQIPHLFDSLTVAETILVASLRGRAPSIWRRTNDVPVGRSVRDIVEATALTRRENDLSPSLAHGLKQGLEIAAAVSMRPEILLLDEPTAGLTSNERHVIGDVFRRLVEAGVTIILIEHDLDFVARVADRVIVLHGGQVAATGTPEEVAASQVVREAYVGTAAE